MKQITLKWTGIRPLIMHNGMLADPTNPFTREIKAINQTRGKDITDAQCEKRRRFEWEGGLYWNDELGPVVPSDNIERCMVKGAAKTRAGIKIQSSVLCEESEYKLDYAGPRKKDALYAADPPFWNSAPVIVNKARIIRVRPMFPPGWSLTITFNFDEEIIGEEALVKCAVDAGTLVGLGDWRPKFGRFTCAQI